VERLEVDVTVVQGSDRNIEDHQSRPTWSSRDCSGEEEAGGQNTHGSHEFDGLGWDVHRSHLGALILVGARFRRISGSTAFPMRTFFPMRYGCLLGAGALGRHRDAFT